MQWFNKLIFPLFILFGLMLGSVILPADQDDDAQLESEEQRARLVHMRNTIKALQDKLTEQRDKHSKLRSQLRHAEKAIGGIIRQLDIIKRKLRQQKKRMQGMRSDRQTLWTDLARQRRVLAGQIRAAYTIGRQEYIKLLLNQQDPAVLGRTLVYYDYLNRARTARIVSIDESVIRLEKLEKQIKQQTARLGRTRKQRQTQKQELEKSLNDRTSVLAILDKRIRTRQQKLEQVQTDASQLERLMQGLRRALADVPANAGQRQAFKSLRGKLVLPVKGKITARYGSRRKGGLRWQGVMIKARKGAVVSTVSHGRIAFADWLRGFGLMVIIDHGDGYMSLYGHNESLYVETGDWVEAGEVVAAVGNSGGQKRSGLYFEIRQNGKPTNPLRWCKRN